MHRLGNALLLATTLCTLGGCDRKPDAPTAKATNEQSVAHGPAQAAPMIAMLKAAKASDASAFKSAYSKRIRDDDQQSDWQQNVTDARRGLTEMYGDFRIEDFTFAFKGDDGRGKLSVLHEPQKKLEIDVVAEGGEWKLDER